MLGETVTRKHNWETMTWTVVKEVHNEIKEEDHPKDLSLKDFDFSSASGDTVFAELFLHLQPIKWMDELEVFNKNIHKLNKVIKKVNLRLSKERRRREKREFSPRE